MSSAKASQIAETLKGQIRSLFTALEAAERERDAAESADRSLTRELQAARREIARLQSLAPRQQEN